MWEECKSGFSRAKALVRARRLALSSLVCLGRHTITGLLCAANRQFLDWSADYRLFSKERFRADALFGVVRREIFNMLSPSEPFIVSMDDSVLKKTGGKIDGAAYRRDPMSPPFHVNLARGIRVLQISAAVTNNNGDGDARMIPADFMHAPTVRKPRKNDPPKEWEEYKKRRKETSLSRYGALRIKEPRSAISKDEKTPDRDLWVLVDGSFTNKNVLRNLPGGCVVMGRIRGDAKLYHPPSDKNFSSKGRGRSYGDRVPTPEELRKDDSVAWQTAKIFACGKTHDFRIKTIERVRWRTAGPSADMRLIVIAPLAYRPRKGAKLLYRKPAYLICTDPCIPPQKVVQAYVWRWDIEVNFRDEKQLIGIQEAQVRVAKSVEKIPAFMTASYAFLLVAAIKAFGLSGAPDSIPVPKWRNKEKKRRATTSDLINHLRYELWGKALEENNFSGFVNQSNIDAKPQEFIPNLTSGVLYAMN